MIGTDVISVSRFAPYAAPLGRAAEAIAPAGPAATPVSFLDGFAYLHPAGGDTGIVFCGSWGYEALCAHRSCVEFGEMLAAAGYPTLRFDYPGAGNSASDLADCRLDDWIAAVAEAAALLKRVAGVDEIVLAGFGFGCLVAAEAAARGLAARGVVLLAPPLTGRRFVRETQALAAMVAAADDGADEVAPGDIAVAGFVMPAAFAAQARTLSLNRLPPAKDAFRLIAFKPEAEAGDLVAELSADGAEVRACTLHGYAEIMAGPTMAATPRRAFQNVLATLRDIAPARPREAGAHETGGAAVVDGGGFVEVAARFGEGERLFGVLCRPAQAGEGAPIAIMISVGRNAHIGWRRMNVENARALARQGVASLRFDLSGVGDSAPRPGQPEQTLYTDWPALDVSEAIDFVVARGFGPVVLLGVCSGAYVGLQAAVNDGRVAGLVAANIYRLVWDPAETVEHALRFGNRRIGPAVSRLLTRARMARILAGRGDLWPALVHAAKRFRRRFGVTAMRYLGAVGPRGALYAECRRRFDILRARGVEATLCYSAGDDGLTEIDDYFGRDRAGLSAYPNVRIVAMERCDHNLTPKRASATLIAEVLRIVDAAPSAQR
ncbi:MAG TPA: alpha/beta fold hydrolase [Rhodoblastus sp.]|nr:alpha/beta fold hydrolase [Rhodoblastus sp.]